MSAGRSRKSGPDQLFDLVESQLDLGPVEIGEEEPQIVIFPHAWNSTEMSPTDSLNDQCLAPAASNSVPGADVDVGRAAEAEVEGEHPVRAVF